MLSPAGIESALSYQSYFGAVSFGGLNDSGTVYGNCSLGTFAWNGEGDAETVYSLWQDGLTLTQAKQSPVTSVSGNTLIVRTVTDTGNQAIAVGSTVSPIGGVAGTITSGPIAN